VTDTPYLTPAEVRERRPGNQTLSGTSDDTLARIIGDFEQIAEEFRGVAYVTRTATHTTYLRCDNRLLLMHRPIQSVTAVDVDGTAVGTTADLAAGVVWLSGDHTGQATCTYTHGLTGTLPGPLLSACVEYVASVAAAEKSSTSRNIMSQNDAGVVVRYSTPDWDAGRPTGWLEVDRLLRSLPDYRIPVG